MAWRRGQAYGQDLRDRVLACPDMTLVEVATRFGVSPSYCRRSAPACANSATRAAVRNASMSPFASPRSLMPSARAPVLVAGHAQCHRQLPGDPEGGDPVGPAT